MKIEQEYLSVEFIEQFEALLNDYYEKTVASDGLPHYDFDWSMYVALQDVDKLLVVTARDGGALLGAAIYFITPHPHHRTMLIAECDSLSVHREHRGESIGANLVAVCQAHLRHRGVKRVINRHRVIYGDKSLFQQLGYRLEERVYIRDLD